MEGWNDGRKQRHLEEGLLLFSMLAWEEVERERERGRKREREGERKIERGVGV